MILKKKGITHEQIEILLNICKIEKDNYKHKDKTMS